MEQKNRWFPCSLKNFNQKQWERSPKKKWSWKTVMLFPFFMGKWLDKILENWIQVPYVSFLFPFCGSCFNFLGKNPHINLAHQKNERERARFRQNYNKITTKLQQNYTICIEKFLILSLFHNTFPFSGTVACWHGENRWYKY